MDIFLNFKNKSYEHQYHTHVDAYVSQIFRSHTVIALVGIPFTIYTQVHHFAVSDDKAYGIRRTIYMFIFYLVLLLTGILLKMNIKRVEKHKFKVKLGFDIFYNLIAGFFLYILWDTAVHETDLSKYLWGVGNGLLLVLMFNNISRWYLRILAFYIFLLRVGINAHAYTDSAVTITWMIELLIVITLVTYFIDKDKRQRFIDKQNIHGESQTMNEMMNRSTDGILIYGLKEGVLFRNWIAERYTWWDNDESFEVNISKVKIQKEECQIQIPKQSQEMISMVAFENWNLKTVIEKYTEAILKERKMHGTNPDKERLKELETKNLILSGVVSEYSSNGWTNNLLEIRVVPLVFQEKLSVALMFTDIINRELMISLQQHNKYTSNLLECVSKKFKEPINTSFDLNKTAFEDPTVPEHVRERHIIPSYKSNKLLLHLTNDVFDLAKMTVKELDVVCEEESIRKTLDECISLLYEQAAQKGLQLLSKYRIKTLTDKFSTDYNRLKQIVLSLLCNAIKFTNKGEIKLKAKLRLSEKYGKILKINVLDTGIGFSNEEMQKLYKILEKVQLDGNSLLNSSKVKLGLMIANSLVLMLGPPEHNNGIKLKSELGKGSIFSFWIPENNFLRGKDLKKEEVSENQNNNASEQAKSCETEIKNQTSEIAENSSRFPVGSTHHQLDLSSLELQCKVESENKLSSSAHVIKNRGLQIGYEAA